MLTYHPGSPNCPEEFKGPADWERRIKEPPDTDAMSMATPRVIDSEEMPAGIKVRNAWRRARAGGRAPSSSAWSGTC